MSDEDKFQWHDRDDDIVVIRTQPAIAVYLNPHGEIVIRQAGDDLYEDDFVYMTRENLPKVIAALMEIGGFELAPRSAAAAPLTPAEKQKRYRDRKRGNADGNAVTEPDLLDLLSRTLRPEKETAADD